MLFELFVKQYLSALASLPPTRLHRFIEVMANAG